MNYEELYKEAEQIGQEMVDALLDGLSDNGIGSSNLGNSIKYRIEDRVLIVDMDFYGEFVDDGTCGEETCGGKLSFYKGVNQPHTRNAPPISDIKLWAENHSINPYAVAANIKKYGTKAHPFTFKIDKIIEDLHDRLFRAAYKDVEKETINNIQKYFPKQR